MLQMREIEFGTPEYDEEVGLRMDVLRKPLNITFEPDALEKEYSDHHLCTLDDTGAIVACLIMTPLGNHEVQMRQFAVAADQQKKGLGTELVKYAEKWASDNGFKKIILHARKTAVPFYIRLNYFIEGEEFIEVNIPHNHMWKQL